MQPHKPDAGNLNMEEKQRAFYPLRIKLSQWCAEITPMGGWDWRVCVFMLGGPFETVALKIKEVKLQLFQIKY